MRLYWPLTNLFMIDRGQTVPEDSDDQHGGNIVRNLGLMLGLGVALTVADVRRTPVISGFLDAVAGRTAGDATGAGSMHEADMLDIELTREEIESILEMLHSRGAEDSGSMENTAQQ